MKIRLLKRLRKINIIEQRGNEYRFLSKIPAYPSGWYIETSWTTNKALLVEKRRLEILDQARKYKKPKKIFI